MRQSWMLAPASALAAVAVVMFAAAAVCAKTGPGNSNSVGLAGVPPDPTVAVKISEFAYKPATVTIKVGTTLKWTNYDSIQHTVTARHGAFKSGNLGLGKSFSHTFKTTGKFSYYCIFHTFMNGTVIVTP
ncbi:MAG TPA: cupredoxin family copper-binding protein [Candidatus Binatia bacterium]|nr:cupredoxin family copper-binding protein [Candidatus Binatia bacterium]